MRICALKVRSIRSCQTVFLNEFQNARGRGLAVIYAKGYGEIRFQRYEMCVGKYGSVIAGCNDRKMIVCAAVKSEDIESFDRFIMDIDLFVCELLPERIEDGGALWRQKSDGRTVQVFH